MKFVLALLMMMSFVLTACGADRPQQSAAEPVNTAQAASPVADNLQRVSVKVNGQEATLVLLDKPASRALLERLPVTVTFEDFNNVEKIGYLPEALKLAEGPEGHAPAVGDFCIYGPWGNLSVFYKEYRFSKDLYYLGRIEKGLEHFTNSEGKLTVTLEGVEK